MADKKPAGKPAPKGGGGSSEAQMIFMAVIAVVVLFVVLPTVLIFFGYSGSVNIIPDHFAEKASATFSKFVDTVGFICIFISLIFIMGMVYAKTRLKEISEAYSAHLKAQDDIGKPSPLRSNMASTASAVPGSEGVPGINLPGASVTGVSGMGAINISNANTGVTNPRWIQIEKSMQSHNMSEWKVAILEADILLYDMLSQMGYEGDSIGEILKKVDKANFVTLDDAWKAHLVRNKIAHQGADFEISKDEADRTIRLFKRVFDEFYFI